MKQMHRPDLFCWSQFNEDRNIDFHSFVWVREGGNIVIDPLPLSKHDLEHLKSLGNIARIVISNSSHVRATAELLKSISANVAGPIAEKEGFPISCDHFLSDNEELVPGFKILELQGSKTPGELAFLIEDSTLITGDLIRSHKGNKLHLLPADKLVDASAVIESVKRLQSIETITSVLPGDGFHFFENGLAHLKNIALNLQTKPKETRAEKNPESVC